MRHKVAGWKLGRNTAHRRSLLRNLVTSLIIEERIETTIPKAKAMRPHVEKMITLGKRGDLAARRLASSYLMTDESVAKLFDTIAPRFGDRNGGYLRIIHKVFRSGDGAATAGEDARAIGAANNDFSFPSSRGRHQALQCALMIEQRVAAGQQETVRLRLCQIQCQFAGLDAVHAQAPGLDDALLAQPG